MRRQDSLELHVCLVLFCCVLFCCKLPAADNSTGGGQNYPLLLERGQLHLSQGELKQARADFSAACWDDDPVVSAMAHIGLGDCYRLMKFRNFDAVRQYRLALRDQAHNCEARYKLAMTGFALRQTDGYRMAARELAKLVCTTPDIRWPTVSGATASWIKPPLSCAGCIPT